MKPMINNASALIRIRRFGRLISEEFICPCFFVLSNRFVFVASILNRILRFPSVTSWLSHCPAPRSWFNSNRIAYSRYSFGLFLTDSFLRTSSLLAFFLQLVFPDRSHLWSCCCQHFRCFLFVPKNWSGSACCDRLVFLSDFTFAGNFFRDPFLSECLVSVCFLSQKLFWFCCYQHFRDIFLFRRTDSVCSNCYRIEKLSGLALQLVSFCFPILSDYPVILSVLYKSCFELAVANIFAVSFCH